MSSTAHPISASEQNKALVKRWFEDVWNKSDHSAIAQLYAPDCILHEGGKKIRGIQEFEKFHDGIRAEFDGIRVTPGISLCEDDLASLRWTVECKHKGSGKTVSFSGISIVRIKDGKFVEAWQNWDQAGVAAQLSA